MASSWWLLCVVVVATVPSSHAECKDKDSLTEIEQLVLETHNALRAKHRKTEPLCIGESGDDVTFVSQKWADDLAKKKKYIATRSPWNDYSEVYYGELLYSGKTSRALKSEPFYVKRTINAWYNEIKKWNFTSATLINSTKSVSNFAQIVWRNTKQVQCGFATYSKDNVNGYHVVCQYFPGGNYLGEAEENVYPLIPESTTAPPKEKETTKNPNPEYVVETDDPKDKDDKEEEPTDGAYHMTSVMGVTLMMAFRALV